VYPIFLALCITIFLRVLKKNGRTSKYCASLAYNCSLNGTNPLKESDGDKFWRLSNALNQDVKICSDADALAGRWVKLYWESNDDCLEGFDPTFLPGIAKDKTCCSGSQDCNAPGATPPPIKCFGTKANYSTGYCAGKTASFSACAVSQTRADERAAFFAKVQSAYSLADASSYPSWSFGATDCITQHSIGSIDTDSPHFNLLNCTSSLIYTCASLGGEVRFGLAHLHPATCALDKQHRR
jgi:hypothetical protein